MMSATIDNKVRVEYRGDRIFRYEFLEKSDLDLATAKKMVAQGDQYAEGLPVCVNLVDTRRMLFISSEARKFLAAQERPALKAVAILINSKLQSGLANLYFKFTEQKTETKLFTDPTEAEGWLRQKLALHGEVGVPNPKSEL